MQLCCCAAAVADPNGVMQVAAGCKTTSHVRCELEGPGACCYSDGEGEHVLLWCCSILVQKHLDSDFYAVSNLNINIDLNFSGT